jgi:hypothetical protein
LPALWVAATRRVPRARRRMSGRAVGMVVLLRSNLPGLNADAERGAG